MTRLFHKFKVAQSAMEKAMLGVFLRERMNKLNRHSTKIIGIAHRISKMKCSGLAILAADLINLG